MSNQAAVRLTVPRPRKSPLGAVLGRVQLVTLPSDVLIEERRPPPVPRRAPKLSTVLKTPPEARLPGEEMLAVLFERLHDLEFCADALDGARFCLEAVAAVIPCRASLAHLFDVVRKEFIVVDAHGIHADTMKLARQGASDPLLRMAMPTGRPFPWHDLRFAPVGKLTRFKEIDDVKSVLVCPVTSGARWYGAIELVDPIGAACFKTEHENAMRYVCDRYAAFLRKNGVITDVATIARFAFGD
jgi:hypothetical protein